MTLKSCQKLGIRVLTIKTWMGTRKLMRLILRKKPTSKKISKQKIEEPVLKLEEESLDEEPLILEEVHKEQQSEKKIISKIVRQAVKICNSF